jgi:transposase
LTFAGIDVGSRTLVSATRRHGKTRKPRAFGNDPAGHAALAQALRQAKVARVCLEATGTYHLDLAVALHDAGFAVMVVNPKAARRFAEAMMSRAKTDPVDAALLAEFAERMPFVAWARPADGALALRAYARYLSALTAQRTQLKNQLHAWEQSRATPAAILEAVRGQIQDLTIQIELIQAQALQHIQGQPALSEPCRLLVSVKGIALASAIALLGELLVLPEGMSARQRVVMAGLDPRHHQSGGSVNKKPRISKAGSRHLRHALYMPALRGCKRFPPHVVCVTFSP